MSAAPADLHVLALGLDARLAAALARQGCVVVAGGDAAGVPVAGGTRPATAADPAVPADAAAADALATADAVLVALPDAAALARWADDAALPAAAIERAWVFVADPADPALEARLLQRGAEALVAPAGRAAAAAAALARTLRHAVERKRLERAARTAYATDLATGLPHQAQLLEHMTQLLALREREPAPMVLLVLHVSGFDAAAQQLGAEAANVLRRKVAVRLRAGLRASDVVAAIGSDDFGVLLGRLESPDDGERVAAKLVRVLQQPVTVAGQPCTLGCNVGLALYPEHGRDALSLLQRAGAQAASVATLGREGYASTGFRAGAAAANDDGDAAGTEPPG